MSRWVTMTMTMKMTIDSKCKRSAVPLRLPTGHQPAPGRVRGFTLVELLVALVLSLFLIGGLLLIVTSSRAASLEAERMSRLQENLRFASDYLVRDVRNAGFRDFSTLTFNQSRFIAEGFAQYGVVDGAVSQNMLVVRYAGRGACGRVFEGEDQLKVIENRYFVQFDAENEGHLICEGHEIFEDMQPDENPVQVRLASGLEEIEFQFLMPSGVPATNVCNFYEEALDTACSGVMMTLTFDGDPQRQIQLVAAFRNVILDWLYQ